MFIHHAFIWLQPALSSEDKALFQEKFLAMAKIPSTGGISIGTPIASSRPVVDSSFDFAITCHFMDQDEHDRYQKHPLHLEFIDQCQKMWRHVIVYDSQTDF